MLAFRLFRQIFVATCFFLATASFSFSQTSTTGIQTMLPLSFEANRGQAEGGVDFVARARGYSVYLRAGKATIHLNRSTRIGRAEMNINKNLETQISLVEANGLPEVQPVDKLPGYSNYILGPDPDQWITHVTQYGKVRYANVYPGIDVIYHGNQNRLEQDFVIHPGTDPGQIRLAFSGQWKPAISNRGDLRLRVEDGEVQLQRPRAYQLIAGQKVQVATNYVLRDGQALFRLGSYDSGRTLIIDPVLVYSTFLGGAFQPYGGAANAVVTDGVGNLYVAGYTDSSNFPVTPGVVGATSPNTFGSNAFVSKINPAGTSLIYSTYIAGMRNGVSGLAVDSLGNVYVAGAGIAGLPIPVGSIPFQATPKNLAILKLNNTGTAVLAGTYLGGSGTDFLSGLAVDPAGDVYLTGGTNSNDFPTQNAWQPALGITGSNSSNAFVTKLNPTMSGLVYSTYLGQSSNSNGTGIALDAARDAYVVGNADVGFPTTTGAFQTTATGPSAFLAKLSVTGSLLYATYLSGSNPPGSGASFGKAVAVDRLGNVFVGGQTSSVNFPVLNPIQPCPGNAQAGFLTEFNSTGSPSFSTCLGTAFTAMSLDANGAVYLLGESDAGLSLKNPIDSNAPPLGTPFGVRWFVSEIDPVARMLLFSSFIGGPVPGNAASTDVLNAIAVDLTGNIYVVGQSATSGFFGNVPAPLFPIFNALQPLFGDTGFCNGRNHPCAYSDAIIMKISPNAGAAAAVSPSELKFPATQLTIPSAQQPLTIYDFGTTALTVSNVIVSGDFAIQPSSCPMVAASGGSCVIQVTFTPTVAGARVGAVTITDSSPGSPHSVHLIGTGGLPLATPSPSSLSFPNQAMNTTSSPQVVTVTDGGAIDLQLSHIQISAGPFSETNTCGTTIGSGGSCTISVTFAPTTTGTFTGNITVTDSAADSPQTIPLTGTGVNSLGLAVAPGASSSVAVTAGTSASYTLSIGGSGISGTASLSCTGAPAGAVCSVPASVSVSASAASTFNVSVSTTSHTQDIPQAIPSPGRFGRWQLVDACFWSPRRPGGEEDCAFALRRLLRWHYVPADAAVPALTRRIQTSRQQEPTPSWSAPSRGAPPRVRT